MTVHLHTSLGKQKLQSKVISKHHPPTTANTNININEEGISACLLINDENPRLREWIAYHYTTLPLTSLIIAIDPASRSTPAQIILNWFKALGNPQQFFIKTWHEKHYLPQQIRGKCKYENENNNSNDTQQNKCLWHHRDRQQYFIMKCLEEYIKLNKTWVLLTDVDEYILPNWIAADDPIAPLDEAPNATTLTNWKYHHTSNTRGVMLGGKVDGWINNTYVRSDIINEMTTTTNTTKVLQYGTVVEDIRRQKFFLRDDIAYYESTAMNTPPSNTIPTLKDPWFAGTKFYATIYNDTYDNNTDGTFLQIHMNWTNGDKALRTFYGGHVITDIKGRMYYIENEARSWPKRILARDAIAARMRLPSNDDNDDASTTWTILDILNREKELGLGPCLSMPRLLYGPREDDENNSSSSRRINPTNGLNAHDFVTLRYKWHASKGEFDSSKYGKTMIDVSRIPLHIFKSQGKKKKTFSSVHRPLIYYCRKESPRYELSLFRVVSVFCFCEPHHLCSVSYSHSFLPIYLYTTIIFFFQNHYLDSFEAYSYRNDARANLRQCKEVRINDIF